MMRSVVTIIAIAFVARSRGKAQDSLDRLVDNLVGFFDQVLKSRPLRAEAPNIRTVTTGLGGSTLPTNRLAAPRPFATKSGKFLRQVQPSAIGVADAKFEGSMSNTFKDDSLAAKRVIWKLFQGNKKYVESRNPNANIQMKTDLVSEFGKSTVDNPLEQKRLQALVLMCPTVFVTAADIFQQDTRFVQTVEAAGCVCQAYDGIVASVEFILQQKAPPVVLVLGNSLSYPIRSAVRTALLKSLNTSYVPWLPNETSKLDGFSEDQSTLTSVLLPAAMDAVAQQPHGSVRRLCELANRLNVFNTIETLLRSSSLIRSRIAAGALQVHGAYLDQRSGVVQFMGQHPLNEKILEGALQEDIARTANAPPTPADESFARLWIGNQRFASERHGREETEDLGLSGLQSLATAGQNPLAVLLGCSDSRAPTEAIFDAQPGDIFAIRNAGNICENSSNSNVGCSTVGSAEYAVRILHTRLFVIMGHTNCGAVTAAVKQAIEDKEALAGKTKAAHSEDGDEDTIGNMLITMRPQARAAVNLLDDLDEQVQLAAILNVFATIEKMLSSSKVIRNAVKRKELEIYGAMYNITTGTVNWLGTHRSLETLVGKALPLHRWKEAPFISGQYTIDHFGGFLGPNGSMVWRAPRNEKQSVWAEPVKELKRGNERFLRGKSINQQFVYDKSDPTPNSLVLSGAEESASVRAIFDAAPRDMLVQRTIGNMAGTAVGTILASLEYSVIRFAPRVILVLGQSDSEVVKLALKYAAGEMNDDFPTSLKKIISRLSVNAVRALRNVEQIPQETSAGFKAKVLRLAVEFNALYYIEQMLARSDVIRHAVNTGVLEIHAAVVDEESGEVDFLGPHPMQKEILSDEPMYE